MFWSYLRSKMKALFVNNKEYEHLRNIPSFHDFTNHEMYLFSQIIHERKFKEGEIVYQEQFPLAVIYFVLNGSLTLISNPENPNDKLVLNKHQFLGIVDMYNENRRKGQAIAGKDTLLLAISHIDFQMFLKSNPSTGVKLLNSICTTLSQTIFQFQFHDEE